MGKGEIYPKFDSRNKAGVIGFGENTTFLFCVDNTSKKHHATQDYLYSSILCST